MWNVAILFYLSFWNTLFFSSSSSFFLSFFCHYTAKVFKFCCWQNKNDNIVKVGSYTFNKCAWVCETKLFCLDLSNTLFLIVNFFNCLQNVPPLISNTGYSLIKAPLPPPFSNQIVAKMTKYHSKSPASICFCLFHRTPSVLCFYFNTDYCPIRELHWLPVKQRIIYKLMLYIY